jgi:type IV pilus assembly protein PilX
MTPLPAARHGQRGATLLVGLVMLAMLGLIGAVTYAVASMEERMVGNTREAMRAFEAAEASLRDCEAQLSGVGTLPAFDGTGGMHMAAGVAEMPLWQTVDWKDAAMVRVLPTALPEVGLPPRCIVEQVAVIDELPVDGAVSGPQPRVQQTVFRVTAVGFGRSEIARTQLQSTFRRQ